MKTLSENAAFGGVQAVYSHASDACGCEMTFAAYLPPIVAAVVAMRCSREAVWWTNRNSLQVVAEAANGLAILEVIGALLMIGLHYARGAPAAPA